MDKSTFEYLKPTDEQLAIMERVRAAAKAFADVLDKELPDGPDKTWALRNHRTTAMWANIAITRQPDGSARVSLSPSVAVDVQQGTNASVSTEVTRNGPVGPEGGKGE